MTDINKYLENQLALAKHRNHNKTVKDTKLVSISKKSQDAAENISKKQNKNFQYVRKKIKINSDEAENTKSHNKCETGEGDSDFVLSSDDDCKTSPTTLLSTRTKKNMKKIIDDGDKHVFNQRISKWKQNIKNACSGTIELSDIDYYTADLQYVLDGNTDVEGNHELQNGLNIPQYIWKQLYKYQKTGVKWLWELHQVEGGGLLGDEMGLGKTVQIIAFLAGLAKHKSGPWVGLGPTIIVAPATVIYQWVSHFHYWCPYLRIAVLHHSGSHSGNYNQLVRDVQASHGILLITYEGVVKYSKCLLSYKWHYLILDEGHKIRNPETQVSKLVKKFQTPHKLLITGSPMQNNLQELWSLFDFMRPGLLGTHKAFMEYFAVPITQGGYANATEFQEATALEIAKALKDMITPYLLRRTKAEVQEHIKLPEKNEQVLFCALSQEQKDLYMGYLTSTMVRSILDKESRYGDPLRARVLIALSTLRKICNHPDIYLYEAHEDGDEINETFGHWKRSGKMTVVQSLLKIWQKQGHRTLIFSQSRAMLCILEQHLQNNDYKYLKMDGTVNVSIRQSLIKTFNENKEYLVFLATTRVGGLGVNLTGADRVIIYDPDWNPATDNQAKERAWRIGQQRNVTVYRLLSAGTIEEKIYQRQIFKSFLSSKVLIDPNQKNILTTSTLQGLFTLEEPNCEGDTETASLFKHTKVKINKKLIKENDETPSSGSVSCSKKKLEAMKRLAKQISKKISSENVSLTTNEDPRERYKQKRHLLLNPPKIETLPEINLLDDKVTNIPFESALSELDIVNMHVKENYEENLLKGVLNNKDETRTQEEQVDNHICDTDMADEEIEVDLAQPSTGFSLPDVVAINAIFENANNDHIENVNNDHIKITNTDDIENTNTDHIKNTNTDDIKNTNTDYIKNTNTDDNESTNTDHIKNTNTDDFENTNTDDIKNTNNDNIENANTGDIENPHSYKRRHSTSSHHNDVIENLVAIKKVKRKKLKHEKETNDDDYVLKKLFAKSTVKNALHHDVVMGLAEKEKQYRIKEEATKRAKKAVKAIKQSAKRNA